MCCLISSFSFHNSRIGEAAINTKLIKLVLSQIINFILKNGFCTVNMNFSRIPDNNFTHTIMIKYTFRLKTFTGQNADLYISLYLFHKQNIVYIVQILDISSSNKELR